jgi:Carboxypeptidase regulatory-like domain
MSRVSPLLVAFVVLTSIAPAPAPAQVQGGATPGVAIPPQLPPGPRPSPPRDQSSVATGTAKIQGAVVASDDGRPLRRVIVRVSAPEMREPRSVTTDLSGRYEIADLPAGRYTVNASRAGFVSISHGQTRPNEMGRPIELRDGQTVERINFALPRGAVITGRVVDEYGEPMAGASVHPMQMRYMNGRQQPMMSGGGGGMFQTPDTGEFRIYGLAPGEYLIQANVQSGSPFEPEDRAGYSTTYYPNASAPSEAQVVRVELGQTISGIEIMLSPVRTSRITGTAIDSRGQPLRTGYVMAMQQSGDALPVMRSQTGQIKPDGTFIVSGVAPGTYTLRANAPPVGGTAPEALVATVTVSGGDVSGVVLMPLQPATITGRILFDSRAATLEPSMLRLVVQPKSPGMMMPVSQPGPPKINDDFTFEAKAAPGDSILRVMPTAPGQLEWGVKSVTLDGRDVTEDGFTLASGASVKGVEVLLTDRFQTIAGVVTNERGEVVTNVTVLVFPQEPERWFPSPWSMSTTAMARPDQNGRYSMRARLRPGDYYAVAVEYLDQNRRNGDRGYLEELSKQAVRFSIREEESKALDLRISTPR